MKSAPIIQLSFAIVSEVFGTTFMKMSDGFTHPVFGLATAACYVASFVLLTFALKHLSLGMAYGIWGGVGTLLTTLVGIVVWDDPFSIVVGIGMIAVVAGIALLSKGTQDRLARTLRGRVFMCPECAAVAARRRNPDEESESTRAPCRFLKRRRRRNGRLASCASSRRCVALRYRAARSFRVQARQEKARESESRKLLAVSLIGPNLNRFEILEIA